MSASPVASSATPTPDKAFSETSVICRECGTLVSGEEAGAFVRWVTCRECSDSAAALASSQQEVARLKAAIRLYIDAWAAKDAADCQEPTPNSEHVVRRARELSRAFGALRLAAEDRS